MNTGNDIQNELKELGSKLYAMPRVMPFHVPDGYFSNLSQSLLEDITAIDGADIYPMWGKTMPHSVPQGYFDTLPGMISSQVAELELSFGKPDASMSIPAGYFESLPAQILAAAKAADAPQEHKPKFIELHTRRWRTISRAAAAVLVLGIGFLSYRTITQPAISPSTETMQELAALPHDSVSNYVQRHIDEFDAETLESAALVAINNNTHNTINANSLTDDEIRQYLNESGWEEGISETL